MKKKKFVDLPNVCPQDRFRVGKVSWLIPPMNSLMTEQWLPVTEAWRSTPAGLHGHWQYYTASGKFFLLSPLLAVS